MDENKTSQIEDEWKKKLTPEQTVDIMDAVLSGLAAAHKAGIVHRDVKPANFLLAGEPGPRERVLLADFGIARALDEANKIASAERTQRLGLETNFVAHDIRDVTPSDMGVTEDVLNTTHDAQVAAGIKESKGRFVF